MGATGALAGLLKQVPANARSFFAGVVPEGMRKSLLQEGGPFPAVPRDTPAEIIERLSREINAGLADPTVKARLAQVSATPLLLSPSEFGAYVASEIEKWGKVVKFAGIKPE